MPVPVGAAGACAAWTQHSCAGFWLYHCCKSLKLLCTASIMSLSVAGVLFWSGTSSSMCFITLSCGGGLRSMWYSVPVTGSKRRPNARLAARSGASATCSAALTPYGASRASGSRGSGWDNAMDRAQRCWLVGSAGVDGAQPVRAASNKAAWVFVCGNPSSNQPCQSARHAGKWLNGAVGGRPHEVPIAQMAATMRRTYRASATMPPSCSDCSAAVPTANASWVHPSRTSSLWKPAERTPPPTTRSDVAPSSAKASASTRRTSGSSTRNECCAASRAACVDLPAIGEPNKTARMPNRGTGGRGGWGGGGVAASSTALATPPSTHSVEPSASPPGTARCTCANSGSSSSLLALPFLPLPPASSDSALGTSGGVAAAAGFQSPE